MNLTKRSYIDTQNDVISVIINNSNSLAIVVLKFSEKLYYVRLYPLEDSDNFYQHEIGGKHVRAKDVRQCDDGLLYCLPFLDNGVFKIQIFDKRKKITLLNVN